MAAFSSVDRPGRAVLAPEDQLVAADAVRGVEDRLAREQHDVAADLLGLASSSDIERVCRRRLHVRSTSADRDRS